MKKIAAMLLAVVMAFTCLFAFAGCGNNDNQTPTKGGSSDGTDVGTFKLGAIGPLTGGAGYLRYLRYERRADRR